MRNYGTLALKIILWFLGITIFLVLLLFMLIQVPAVQNLARAKAVNYLEHKIGTRVEINRLSLDLPKLLVLEDVYFEDQKKDTLLAGDTLKVDISLLKLLRNTVEINEIDLRGVTAHINRTPDSVFNFDYILKAFVSEQKKPVPQDTSAAPMKFSVDKVNLDRIRVNYQDAPTANDVRIYLGHFDTRIREFNADSMRYNVPRFKLSDVNAVIVQGKPAVKADSKMEEKVAAAQPINFDLQLGMADLDRIKVVYRNDVSAVKADVNLGKATVKTDKLDMKNKRIDLNSLKLDNSSYRITLGRKPAAKVVAKEVKETAEAQAEVWSFSSDNISITNNDLRFDDMNQPVLRRGIDYGHLNIRNLNLNTTDFLYAIDTISGQINSASMQEKSGLDLRRLQARFFYGSNKAYLENLYLQTDKTLIRNEIRLGYRSIKSITENPGEMRIDARLNNTRLGFRDILVFAPQLAATDPFRSNPNSVLNVNGSISGQLKNLSIPRLQLSGFRNTRLDASGRIRGLPDINKAFFDLNIHQLNTRRADIYAIAPPGSIPSNIRIPEALAVKGIFRGGISRFNTNLTVNSSYGSAKVAGFFNNGAVASYNGTINTYNFNVGKLIKQEKTLGRISMTAKVNGSGLDAKTFSGHLSGRVVRAEYNRYNYHNLILNAVAKRGIVRGTASMTDPNINFDLNATANLNRRYPAIRATLNVDSLNLQKLNFTTDDFRFRGHLVADLPTADPDYLNADILLTDAIVVASGKRLPLDSVSLVSKATPDSNSLRIRSEIINANASGKYKLTQIGPAFQSVVYQYFNPNGAPLVRRNTSDQHLRFNATMASNPIISQFKPAIKEISTITLAGNFNNQTGELNLQANAPRIVYAGYDLNNLALNASTGAAGNNALNYSITMDRFTSAQMQILNTSLNGNIRNNQIFSELQVKDAADKQRYRVAGTLQSRANSTYELKLQPDGLLLNYEAWTVSSNNSLVFGTRGFQASDFVLSRANQQISINSSPPGLNNPVAIRFNNFRIETISEIARKDSLLAGGTINGTALVRNLQSSPVFTAQMTVSDFNFRGDTVGNIALKVNNQTANTLAANATITGKGNDVNLAGSYYISNQSYDMTLNIVNLNLKSIEGFTMGNLEDASGSLNGRLAISGTAAAPRVNGAVNFNNTAFRISMFNSLYRVDDERITFNDEGIRFDSFTILDSAGNEASVDGMLLTRNFTDYRFNLDISSDNFQALNSTAKDNELYYGKLFIDTRIRIRGDIDSPDVDGSLRVLKNTSLTVLVPQTDPGLVDREGIVEFVDMDHPENGTALTSNIDTLNTSRLTGMDVSANIEVDKEAEFNLIVDQGNGDFLQVRGEADLVGGIDPSGKLSLTGTYVLEQGAYELSFNFIRRRFDIRKGSKITWNGEPTSADIDVTAVYVAETAPIDLVASQLGGEPQATLNTYKQRLPFELLLKLQGELMKPQIAFDIVLPERNYNVSGEVITAVNARLDQIRAQPSELNKQAFALVLLNRFVSDNPFSSQAGGTSPESMARQSVSKLLTQQLNNLAGGLIAGVNLNFDLEASDDYTTGELKNRTDLNVTASKRLLNDRLNVSVGSNFELEGPRQASRETNNIAGDIAIDYILSKDGRYKLRFYRRDQYQVAVEGQVIETGLSFILNMDYNKFTEILRGKTEEEKKRRQAEKEEKKIATNE